MKQANGIRHLRHGFLMKIDEVLSWLRALAPEDTAMDGDPIGLLIHPVVRDVKHVVVCLDATPAIALAAAREGAELIVCHHPLIYRPLSAILESDPIGQSAITLIQEGIALYAMHTNWDRAQGGINDTLAQKIGMVEIQPLAATGNAQAARIGKISACTVSVLASHITSVLALASEDALRFSQEFSQRIVQTLAVCGGAGAMLLQDALAAGADAFVTSDVRHHEFIDATARGVVLIDAGHGATERPGMASLAQQMSIQFPNLTITYLA